MGLLLIATTAMGCVYPSLKTVTGTTDAAGGAIARRDGSTSGAGGNPDGPNGVQSDALIGGSGGVVGTGGSMGVGGVSGSGGKSGSGGSSNGGSGGLGSGGSANNGGSANGGANNGGSAQGGSNSGGSANGGGAQGGSVDGSNSGGSANGGGAQGGSAKGGSNNGGSNSGGSSSGGSDSGGNAQGGSNFGGNAQGGSNSGGSAQGGNGAGGSANGGSGAGGSGSGTRPPGYFMTADWSVTKVDWHGCVWTGKDSTVAGSDTSVVPVDFTSGTPNGGPYRIQGSVYNDYNAVALLGFNLNEAATGVDTQCKSDPAAGTKDGPPTVTMPPSGATGIAVNWSATKLPLTFRIQIQGVKGGSDPTNRWCATITDSQGPSFVPFSAFSTTCWNTTGIKYNNEPIDAVGFLVPGTVSAKSPYDITVVGFAPGTSVADAPGKAAACGMLTGTVGSASASLDASMQRAAVTATDCKKYIINNNNWGQPTFTTQILNYTANSFTIQSTSGSGGGSNVVSFPSIYIGANGQIANGTFNTWTDSGLPKQISAINSAQSTFKWSGGNSGGNYNAAYDIWFAKSSPTAGSYYDAISGFIMIWLYEPGQSQPIGSSVNTRSAIIDGQAYTVWRGPRNGMATGTDGAGRPVISYVANSTNNNFSADLKAFFDDAVTNGADDMSKGSGITQAFSSSWYLTDVFAGFEIWNGSDANGLQDTFTCVIQ